VHVEEQQLQQLELAIYYSISKEEEGDGKISSA
jgi:hypothetical protein